MSFAALLHRTPVNAPKPPLGARSWRVVFSESMRVEIVARPEAAVGRSVWMARGRNDSGMSASALPRWRD